MSLACPRSLSGYEPSLSPLATCNERRSDATCTGCNGRNSYLRLLRSGVSCLQGYLESCHRRYANSKTWIRQRPRSLRCCGGHSRRRRSCFSSRGNLMMGVTTMEFREPRYHSRKLKTRNAGHATLACPSLYSRLSHFLNIIVHSTAFTVLMFIILITSQTSILPLKTWVGSSLS